MGMGMGTGKFTQEWGWGWGIFCGDGMGMGKISWGRDGDGENFLGMGRGWGQFYWPCHSLIHAPNMAAFSSDCCPLKLLQPVLPSALSWSSLSQPRTLQLRHLPRNMAFNRLWCRRGSRKRWQLRRPRLLRILSGLQTGFVSRVVLGPWWFRPQVLLWIRITKYVPKLPKTDVHEHDQTHLVFLPRTRFRFCSPPPPVFGIPPKICRHSARSALRPSLSIALAHFTIHWSSYNEEKHKIYLNFVNHSATKVHLISKNIFPVTVTPNTIDMRAKITRKEHRSNFNSVYGAVLSTQMSFLFRFR